MQYKLSANNPNKTTATAAYTKSGVRLSFRRVALSTGAVSERLTAKFEAVSVPLEAFFNTLFSFSADSLDSISRLASRDWDSTLKDATSDSNRLASVRVPSICSRLIHIAAMSSAKAISLRIRCFVSISTSIFNSNKNTVSYTDFVGGGVVEYIGVFFVIIETFPREDGSGVVVATGSGVDVATGSGVVVATGSGVVVTTGSGVVVATGSGVVVVATGTFKGISSQSELEEEAMTLEYFPRGQSRQAAAPLVGAYVPVLQSRHVSAKAAANTSEYLPSTHSSHINPVFCRRYVPRAHCIQGSPLVCCPSTFT